VNSKISVIRSIPQFVRLTTKTSRNIHNEYINSNDVLVVRGRLDIGHPHALRRAVLMEDFSRE